MTSDVTGRGRAVLVEDDTEFDERDAILLRAIDRTGSVASAADELGRSRPWALRRIESLEAAFGSLVERQRGGSGGGGSKLTANGTVLLARYERLKAAITATARIPETVVEGSVTAVDGELATVETTLGDVQAFHDSITAGDRVQLRIGADAITLHAPRNAPEPNATSARNRLRGVVEGTDPGETVLTVRIDVGDAVFRSLVTADSASRLDLTVGRDVVLTWKATATRLVQY